MITEPAKVEPESDNAHDEYDEYGGPVKSFLEHLEDLRWVIIKILLGLVIGMVVCMAFANHMIGFFQHPIDRYNLDIEIKTITPIASFVSALKVAFWGGLAIASPWVLYVLGSFIIPALKPVEKRYIYIAFCIGTGLFFLGACLAYWIILPLSLKAFQAFSVWVGMPSDFWDGAVYLPFASKLILGVGFSFELPVVILALVKIGILNHEALVKGRKYMVIGNLVLAAFITPQDILSTVMMAAPLCLLYEICIWIAAFWEKREREAEAASEIE